MENGLPKRKPNRLKEFDYSTNGAYFITICTQNRKQILSSIVVGDGLPVPKLTKYGKIVLKLIDEISIKYPNAIVDKFIIMPNHIHLILVLSNKYGTGNPSPTVSNVVSWLKYNATKEINACTNSAGVRVFQRSFYDHIIRNEDDYLNIWEYVNSNALKWAEDEFYTGDENIG